MLRIPLGKKLHGASGRIKNEELDAFLSVFLSLVFLGVLVFLNDRYGLWAKVRRVALEESLGKI